MAFLRCFQAILTLLPGHSYVASRPFLRCFQAIFTMLPLQNEKWVQMRVIFVFDLAIY